MHRGIREGEYHPRRVPFREGAWWVYQRRRWREMALQEGTCDKTPQAISFITKILQVSGEYLLPIRRTKSPKASFPGRPELWLDGTLSP
jgi:hypothetical protein